MSCYWKHIAHAQMYILSAELPVDSSKYLFICMSQTTAVAQTSCRPRRKSSPYSTHLFIRHSIQKGKQHIRRMLELPPTLVLLKFLGVHATQRLVSYSNNYANYIRSPNSDRVRNFPSVPRRQCVLLPGPISAIDRR